MLSKEKDQRQISLIHNYFDAWNNQDIKKLGELVSNDIELMDWQIKASGQKEFLTTNQKIFSDNPKIKSKILNLFVNNQEVIAKLVIQLAPNTESLHVIDYFKIENGLIKELRAYRGF